MLFSRSVTFVFILSILTTFSFAVVKACFATRRKNLKNSLMNAGFNKDAVAAAIKKLNWDENTRGETLSIEKLAELSEELQNKCKQ